ncbi:STAS domain-containing protein [Streptomyces sp. PLK6-54]|uniref:STAS domain-containing protein n=1 Tax=Actinacidiphila acidipaludis TaxID=2873382 RepID=A0ABS7QAA2_9ACTN|nr:STAS domain-containing protein [Streptomyces acidipaludis]
MEQLTVTVDGPLDFDTSEELLETVGKTLAEFREEPLLALDLGGLTLCDSMGLSALLAIRRRTTAEGVRLVLLRRPRLLDRLLELTGTAEYLIGTPGGEDEHSEP